MSYTKKIGAFGESLAADYLKKRGVRILKKNYDAKGGEIDLIGFSHGGLIFFEVKTRSGNAFGTPASAIGGEKLRCVEKAARQFLYAHTKNKKIPVLYFGKLWIPRRIRFTRIDGIEVYLYPDGTPERINRIEDMGYEIRQHARTE